MLHFVTLAAVQWGDHCQRACDPELLKVCTCCSQPTKSHSYCLCPSPHFNALSFMWLVKLTQGSQPLHHTFHSKGSILVSFQKPHVNRDLKTNVRVKFKRKIKPTLQVQAWQLKPAHTKKRSSGCLLQNLCTKGNQKLSDYYLTTGDDYPRNSHIFPPHPSQKPFLLGMHVCLGPQASFFHISLQTKQAAKPKSNTSFKKIIYYLCKLRFAFTWEFAQRCARYCYQFIPLLI